MPATPKFDPSTDIKDLRGKVAIVTGGNGGIGFETVRALARAGAKVYIGARNESRATGAIAALEHEGLGPGNGTVHYLHLELSDPLAVKKAGEEFLKRETRLDILVHNAGQMSAKGSQSQGELSPLVTTNYLGPFILTQTLLPLMKETAKEADSDVRIVYVASMVHKWTPAPLKFETVQDFNNKYSSRLFLSGLTQYGYSKFLGVLWAKTLQHRLNQDPNSPITVISLHPGAVNTPVQYETLPFPGFFKFLFSLIMIPVVDGSNNSVFAAASKKVAEDKKAYQGVYLWNDPVGTISEPHAAAQDVELGQNLWRLTEEYLTSLDL